MTNIAIAIGIMFSVIFGIYLMVTGEGFVILFGFLVIPLGILFTLEAVAMTKIIIYASEDISLCKEYLKLIADIQEGVEDDEIEDSDDEDEEMWQCEKCEWWNNKKDESCQTCCNKNTT
jgi:hypothetical protein